MSLAALEMVVLPYCCAAAFLSQCTMVEGVAVQGAVNTNNSAAPVDVGQPTGNESQGLMPLICVQAADDAERVFLRLPRVWILSDAALIAE